MISRILINHVEHPNLRFGKKFNSNSSKENWGITGLPIELILKIFGFLDPQNLGRVSGVCRLFNRLSQDRTIWLTLCTPILENRIQSSILINGSTKKTILMFWRLYIRTVASIAKSEIDTDLSGKNLARQKKICDTFVAKKNTLAKAILNDYPLEIIDLFVHAASGLTTDTTNKKSSLDYALQKGYALREIQPLLKKVATITSTGPNQKSSLDWALSSRSSLDVIKLLLDKEPPFKKLNRDQNFSILDLIKISFVELTPLLF